ncbi:hypothetical protein LWE61_17280 [Sphingobium sufflavum]|uniref:hypothetical protein n=1 Tax=Sphingobium sufflavum TaxID=1129547 RepID=UPI001F3FE68E|nr:hypothetical protein [Sphingobium sufflavum]MCE7798292.1 hypothetical protein [Sphingobium sufflavum]
MNYLAILPALLIAVAPAVAPAQTPAAPAPAAKVTSYTVEETDIGTLLDDPAAKAVIDKHMPGFSSNPQVDMARSMTLKIVQQYSPDTLTDQALAAIQADLAKLPRK